MDSSLNRFARNIFCRRHDTTRYLSLVSDSGALFRGSRFFLSSSIYISCQSSLEFTAALMLPAKIPAAAAAVVNYRLSLLAGVKWPPSQRWIQLRMCRRDYDDRKKLKYLFNSNIVLYEYTHSRPPAIRLIIRAHSKLRQIDCL